MNYAWWVTLQSKDRLARLGKSEGASSEHVSSYCGETPCSNEQTSFIDSRKCIGRDYRQRVWCGFGMCYVLNIYFTVWNKKKKSTLIWYLNAALVSKHPPKLDLVNAILNEMHRMGKKIHMNLDGQGRGWNGLWGESVNTCQVDSHTHHSGWALTVVYSALICYVRPLCLPLAA